MRDPNRIDEFCEALAKAWHRVPDWRFGQLVSNLPYPMDPFFIEDDDMLALIEGYLGVGDGDGDAGASPDAAAPSDGEATR